MNCPMCGAPLGDNDFECSKCFTKRSEMGPAYNNNGGYGGGSYGNGGYGNNGYGNNSYGNNSYGNTGYGNNNYANGGYNNNANQNNGYGTSYNTSYGSTNNYGSNNGLGGMGNYGGMGYSSAGVKPGMSSKNIAVTIVLVIVFLLAAGFAFFIRPSMFKTYDAGYFTVSLPSTCKETSTTDIDLGGMGDAIAFENRDMQFACLHMDFGSLGATTAQMNLLKDQFVDELDKNFKIMYPGYTTKSKTDDMIKFTFSNSSSTKLYAEMKTLYKGADLYVVICMCEESDTSKMIPKFSKVFNSIQF